MRAMKKIILSLLIASVASAAVAEDAIIAELQAKVAKLELQNQTLRRAVEAIAGKPIEQIVGIVSAPAVTVAPKIAGPTAEQLAAMNAVKARIAELEKMHYGPADPFADRPGTVAGSNLRMSRADIEKQKESDLRELDVLKKKLAAMEAAVAAN